MSATEIIQEIERLPANEQAEVIEYAFHLDADRMLSGKELGQLARHMVDAGDPVEAMRWRDATLRGFYGRAIDA